VQRQSLFDETLPASAWRLGGLVSELIDQEELVLARSDEGIDRLHHRGGRSKPSPASALGAEELLET